MLKFEAEKNRKNHRINRPWSIQGAISVAYGNIPAPAAEKRRTRSGVFLRIVCGCLAEAGAVKEIVFNINKKQAKEK